MRDSVHGQLVGVCMFVAIVACSGDATAPIQSPDSELSDYDIGERSWQASLPGVLGSPAGYLYIPGCVFDASTGRIVCPDRILEDITVETSYQLLDADGVPQAQKGPNVFSINARVRVSGSTPLIRGGTATVDRTSELTRVGFGAGITQHTTNGTENGTISISRVDAALGAVNTVETFTHTVTDVVIPNTSEPTIPVSGVVTRTVLFVRTIVSTGEQYTLNYNEVTTFNGSKTITSVVTKNGVTVTCIRDRMSPFRCD